MAIVRMSDEELARDLGAVLARVQEGMEVIIERDQQPIAVLSPPKRSGRSIVEILAAARGNKSNVVLNGDFEKDLTVVIEKNSQPWNRREWE